MIEIGEKGGGTDTYLTQNILILDRTAKVEAIPALEIKTNDVKASHSATVTKVSEEDLFYMTSRGIAREEARALYVSGFLKDLLGRIAHPQARRIIEEAVGERA
jgi:Fe-S cluster assembly protein SufB/Fe-S cluster assembly protein SufD